MPPPRCGNSWRAEARAGLAYEHDHVLDGMVEELGLAVETCIAPFEPEAGGYRHGDSNGEHQQGDGHEHGHTHGHGHGHGH